VCGCGVGTDLDGLVEDGAPGVAHQAHGALLLCIAESEDVHENVGGDGAPVDAGCVEALSSEEGAGQPLGEHRDGSVG
jgi:hypothetical protein